MIKEKNNKDIRACAKENGVTLGELARKMRMYQSELSVMLREELPSAKKAEMLYTIREIARGKKNDRANDTAV